MSSKWPVVPIKELCEDVNVGFVGPSTKFRDDEGIPFLMGKNIGSGFLKLKNLDRVSTKFHNANKKSQLRGGDVVVVRIGNSGQACTIPDDFGEANCAGLVIIKQPSRVLAEYLTYYLNSPIGRSYSMSQAIGSTRSTLNTSTVASTLVPLPPLDEQKRIVAKLDDALADLDHVTENSKTALEQVDSLWGSYLESAFNQNPTAPVTFTFNYVRLGDHVQFDKRQSLGIDLPYVGLEDIEPQTGKLVGSVDAKKVKSATFLFDERHVLYGRLRAYLNKYLTPSFAGHCSTEIFPLLPDSKIHRDYLAYWLSSPRVCDLIDATGRGARMPRANMNEVLNFPFPLAPLDEQKQMVAKLDDLKLQIDSFRKANQVKIQEANSLRSSILSSAFAGDF